MTIYSWWHVQDRITKRLLKADIVDNCFWGSFDGACLTVNDVVVFCVTKIIISTPWAYTYIYTNLIYHSIKCLAKGTYIVICSYLMIYHEDKSIHAIVEPDLSQIKDKWMN